MPYVSVCRRRALARVRAAAAGYEAKGGGVCISKGLVQCVRGPFRLLSSQTKLWWRGSLQQDMAAGGERAAAALQTYSPAGGGYLSHLVHSSGWPIPSTATTATHGEGHIWPYLSMCAAVYQHTHTAKKQPFADSVGKRQNRQHREKVCRAEPSRTWNRISQG